MPTAIRFITDKARELALPCVMLPNIGSIGGPTDGTSALSRLVDATVGPGIPGLVFVNGTGDDGGRANRVQGSVPAGGSTRIDLVKATNDSVFLDFWYDEHDRFDVVLHTPTGAIPLESPTTNVTATSLTTPAFRYFHYGSDVDPYAAQNAKRTLVIW